MVDIQRFIQHAHHALVQSLAGEDVGGIGCHQHHWQTRLDFMQTAMQFHAIHLRHFYIADHTIKAHRAYFLERVGTRGSARCQIA